MATEPILASLDASVAPCHTDARSSVLSDYWALTKPEINFLIAITTVAGFWMGSQHVSTHLHWLSLLHAVVGTVLVASGTATLNQLIEMRFDAMMRRTWRRPVASGRIEPRHALWFGTILSLAGAAYLAAFTTILASLLAVFTLLSYLFLYTPAKRKTPLCTLIGAVPGAVPPLIGWAAATGHLAPGAWALFAIVFLWQFPHFMAIAWMYREDYARAGYLVLPVGESRARFVFSQALLPALALVPVGAMPMLAGGGWPVLSAALILGLLFCYYSADFAFRRSSVTARRLLAASIVYLPVLFALLFFT